MLHLLRHLLNLRHVSANLRYLIHFALEIASEFYVDLILIFLLRASKVEYLGQDLLDRVFAQVSDLVLVRNRNMDALQVLNLVWHEHIVVAEYLITVLTLNEVLLVEL